MKETPSSFESEPVGNESILRSANVRETPSKINKPVVCPSVYQDERGEIHNFRIGGRRVNILRTKAGVMRSGDIHKVRQRDLVFSGRVEVWCLEADGSTTKTIYLENQYIVIPPFTPHVFNFLEDTVLAEWWDGPFHAWYYLPYRSIVDDSFSSVKKGSFSLYEVIDAAKQEKKRRSTILAGSSFALGLLAALGLGYSLGKRR